MPIKCHLHLTVLASALLAAATGIAAAQQPTSAQASAIRSACRADYQAKCSSVPPGGSASLACLQQNASSVSAPCQQALAAVTGTPASGQPATEPSPAAQAAPITPAPASKPPVPVAGAGTMPRLPPRQEAMILRQACARDYQSLCRGVPLGGGRAIGCLERNASRLSPNCRGTLAAARQGR
jgi:hypothetical protein